MKKLTMVPALVLLVLPLVAVYTDGGFRAEAAIIFPFTRPAVAPPVPTDPDFRSEPSAPALKAPVVQTPRPVPAVEVPKKPPTLEAPKSSWIKAPLLAGAVARAMADFPGTYSAAVQDLKTGERWVLNPDDRYHPASTIKMPVTLYALEQYRAGKIRWDEGIEYTEADFESPGGGAFETAPFGGIYPVENLVGRALRYSNNVAVNMLGRRLGWNNIRAWTRSIGGDLYREEDGSPEVTVLSELGWWLHLDRISHQDPQRAELVLQPLREVAYDGRIAAGLPSSVSHLHKFGSYDGYFHDGGIVFGEHPYAVIILTHGAKEYEADAAIAGASAAIYQIMSAR